MLEGGNLRWDRAQHCLTEGSLRSPVPVLANFRPLTASSPPANAPRGGADAPLCLGVVSSRPIQKKVSGSHNSSGTVPASSR